MELCISHPFHIPLGKSKAFRSLLREGFVVIFKDFLSVTDKHIVNSINSVKNLDKISEPSLAVFTFGQRNYFEITRIYIL